MRTDSLLHRLGLAAAIDEVGGWVGEGSTYYRHDGTMVAPVMTTDSSGWAAMYGMHRADLVDVLRQAIPADRIHPGHRAVSFEQDTAFGQQRPKARVAFQNDAVAEGDLVIAADGIHRPRCSRSGWAGAGTSSCSRCGRAGCSTSSASSRRTRRCASPGRRRATRTRCGRRSRASLPR